MYDVRINNNHSFHSIIKIIVQTMVFKRRDFLQMSSGGVTASLLPVTYGFGNVQRADNHVPVDENGAPGDSWQLLF